MSTARIPDRDAPGLVQAGRGGRCPVCGYEGAVLGDFFSGDGGAGMGYHRAGWHVCGIDNRTRRPLPRYPFCFVQADAMTYPMDWGSAYHASPPCQDYSKAMRHLTSGYPRLIDPIRDRLETTGQPWVIENVPGAPLPVQSDLFGGYGVMLCGTMFGRPYRYHRLFGTSFPIVAPRGCDHSIPTMNPRYGSGPGRDTEAAWREAIGTPWASQQGGREAVPVPYAEYVGAQLLEQISEPSPAARESLL